MKDEEKRIYEIISGKNKYILERTNREAINRSLRSGFFSYESMEVLEDGWVCVSE